MVARPTWQVAQDLPLAEIMRSEQRIVRFGVFEVDLRGGELRQQGVRIKLQEKPFQVLARLLEHPGEVVTREELRERLWPGDTFVDFDHSLNIAIAKLREALGDSADAPHFVETLPRRGYRFIYPVEKPGAPTQTPRYWPRGLWIAALVLVALALGLVSSNVSGLRDRLLGRPAPGEITSIAVLPLANLSGDTEEDYFSDGMTDALITELGQISALRVISRQSVMQYKGTHKPLPEIARELNVDAVMEGSALHEGERVRITAQLVQAVPERHLWAESYERDLSSVLSLQREVARAIAGEIRVTLTQQEQARLARAHLVNPEAYEAYLKGRYHWNKRTPENIKKGLAFFEQAIAIDPAYAVAYAGVADSLIIDNASYIGLSPEEVLRRATAAATKALELDDTLAEAHTSLAVILSTRYWDWAGAEREYKRAIELSPGYSTAHQWYAEFLSYAGRHDEALAQIGLAREIDPTSLVINAEVGTLRVFASRLDEGIEQLGRTLELDPTFFLAHAALGRAYMRKKLHKEAIAEFGKAEAKALLAHAYAVTGERAEARKILDEVERLWKQGYAPATDMAKVYAGLQETDQAFAWLEKAYEARDPNLIMIDVEPEYDSLRSDPRFRSLLTRMNFPD